MWRPLSSKPLNISRNPPPILHWVGGVLFLSSFSAPNLDKDFPSEVKRACINKPRRGGTFRGERLSRYERDSLFLVTACQINVKKL